MRFSKKNRINRQVELAQHWWVCKNCFKTNIEKGTPFKRYITKAIEQTSKFTEGHAKSREQKISSCMPKTAVLPKFKALQLMESYLSSRQKYTKLNPYKSKLGKITCGVPLGSSLGPLLFLLNINDLPLVSQFDTTLFANDTNLI